MAYYTRRPILNTVKIRVPALSDSTSIVLVGVDMNKKTIKKILLVALAATIICTLALSACTPTSWNISADSSSRVTAKIIKTTTGYSLNIGGKGKMKDFETLADVPWRNQIRLVNSIIVTPGVTYIGKNAFDGANVDYIVLPKSVESVGDNFAGERAKVFAHNADIKCPSDCDLYLYSEETITTVDRYWQSDKSSGDIVADGETIGGTNGKYWHYGIDDQPQVYAKTKVLFIGNSFTYRNGEVEFSSGIPGIFDNIAEDLGFVTETYSITGPGWYLDNHAKKDDKCGKQVDKLLRACDDFDYIVLQDQSQVAYKDNDRFKNGIKELKEKIQATQKHAKIYLYETWGSPFSAKEDGTTVQEMEMKLRNAYAATGEEFGLRVSYVGKAFTSVYNNHKEIYLWASDNRHQGYTGAYLSACVHVANMLGGDVRNTTFVGEAQYSAPNLSKEVLIVLRNTAYNVVKGTDNGEVTNPSNPDNPSQDNEEQKQILKIACWGRFMKEAKFNELVNDFKQYLATNNITYKEIVGTYYQGATNSAPYYYIAQFAAKVYSDGNPDIVLPCANDFNAKQSTLATVKRVSIDVYGQTGRMVGALNDDELTDAFLTYVQTDSAKAILAKAD